ncbi:hypothetical protein ACF0H5_004978 [Mactra antiquata]
MDKSNTVRRFNHSRIKVLITVDVIIWISVGLPGFYLFLQATPYEQGFFCDDISLSYPYKEDTVSTSLLIAFGFIVSSFIVIIVELLNGIESKCKGSWCTTKSVVFCIKRYAVFLVGMAIQLLIVEVIKNMMGVLRPNFFDVCKPSYNTSQCPGFIRDFSCTNTELDAKEIRISRQSFPSGHSAFSMYIATFFCIYIQKRLHVTYTVLLKFIMQTTLIFLSLLCGLGRMRDNKHHTSDIISGFIIGFAVAAAAYKTVCVDVLDNKDENQSDARESEKLTFHYDICDNSDNISNKDPHTPTPLLVNEKQENTTDFQRPNLLNISYSANHTASVPSTTDVNRQTV